MQNEKQIIKIVLITPILQHYRLTFYEKLAKARPDFDLNVLFGFKLREDGRPSFLGKTNFKSKGFRELKYRILPFDLVYNLGMFSEVKRINPDVVIMQGIAGDLTNRCIISWAKRKNKKIIIWACGWEPGRAKSVLLKFKNLLVSAFFKKADYFLTYSTHASNYVKDMRIDDSIIETCYNGIETDEMESNSDSVISKSEEIKKTLNLENYITFLYVGGLIKEKRPEFLVEAFEILRRKYNNIKLVIIGDGPMKKELELSLEKISDKNILYLGRIIDDVDAYFAATDCFVMPGIGGLALNQAMYWGKPCIVSKADGTEDDLVIDGYSGYRFKANDIESLVSAMEKRITEAPEKLKEMAKINHKIISEKSNVNNMVDHFVQAIEKLRSK